MNQLGSVSDVELATAFLQEWREVEASRKYCLQQIGEICKSVRELRIHLKDYMLEVLVEDQWKQGEVVQHLADVTLSLIKAINSLKRKETIGGILGVAAHRLQSYTAGNQEGVQDNCRRQQDLLDTEKPGC